MRLPSDLLSRSVARLTPASLQSRPDWLAVLALATLALALRLAFATRAAALGTKDSLEYFEPAFSLVNGQGFELALRRPPLYPLFVASVMQVLGQNLAAVAFVQHLVGVVTVVLTYWLGRLVFGRGAGLVGGLLAALNSVLIIHEHYILSESVFTLLLTACCLLLVLALRRDSPAWYFAAGLGFGVAVLARPVAQSLLLAVPLAVYARHPALRRAWRPTLVVLLGAALLIVPWTFRNQLTHGELSASGSGRFLSARVVKHDRGYTFYDPASAERHGELGAQARQIFQEEADKRPEEGPIYSRYRSELGLSEADADALLREISLEGIARRPWHYFQTTAVMFLDLFAGDQKEELLRWHYRERDQERLMTSWGELRFLLSPLTPAQLAEQQTAEALGSIYRPTRWLSPLVIGLLLAVVAGWLRTEHRPALFLAAVVGVTLLVCAALVGEVPRYRYPLDPLIGVLAAGGYGWALGAARAVIRRRSFSVGQTRPFSLPGR